MASTDDDREPSSVLAERPAETEGARLAAIAALFGPFTAGARKKGGVVPILRHDRGMNMAVQAPTDSRAVALI
jgi:hypothetical protein